MDAEEDYVNTVLITLIQQAISLLGIVFNFAVIWITFKNKNLQNSSGYLLAVYSFCEFGLESSTILGTFLVLLHRRISLLHCFLATSLQTIWLCSNAYFSLFFISLDRLVAIKFPVFYRHALRRGAGKYVFLLNLISSGYIFVMLYFGYIYALENREKLVYCEPGDQIGGAILSWGFMNAMVLHLATLFVYILLGIVILQSGSNNPHNDSQIHQTRRIFKSLATIMGVIFFLYFFGVLGGQWIVPLLTTDPQRAFLYFRLFAQLITVAGAINAPVLYFCSTEYRLALNQYFPFVPALLAFFRISIKNSNNSVHPASTSPNPPAIPIQTIEALNASNGVKTQRTNSFFRIQQF